MTDNEVPTTIKAVLDLQFAEADRKTPAASFLREAQAAGDTEAALRVVIGNDASEVALAAYLMTQVAGLRAACYQLADAIDVLIAEWHGHTDDVGT
jgi:UDP-glucose 6-dehydrogenase